MSTLLCTLAYINVYMGFRAWASYSNNNLLQFTYP